MREININIDTTLNFCQVTDFDSATGKIHFEVFQALGFGWTYERENADVLLTDPDCMLKISGLTGETGFFKIAEMTKMTIDGSVITINDMDALIVTLAPLIFA